MPINKEQIAKMKKKKKISKEPVVTEDYIQTLLREVINKQILVVL